ncbi:hypothetical protein [Pseudomonas entomophila]|uniref:hypothetical protein n=1 Tax=Pseudomonas entomophila TaxID=312306 RepID=UPI001F011906|nr:hypothetical protein [Pseudomonas entomophila]MCG8292038.1 hypothetical protein [Pseudomonas entomophila]
MAVAESSPFKALFEAMQAAQGPKVRKTLYVLSRAFDDASCELDTPQLAVDFVVAVFASCTLCDKPGMSHLVAQVGWEFHRYDDAQKQQIYRVLCDTYSHYQNGEFCWRVCELVARQYTSRQAMDFFKRQSKAATGEGRQGINAGLQVMARNEQHNRSMLAQIQQLKSRC